MTGNAFRLIEELLEVTFKFLKQLLSVFLLKGEERYDLVELPESVLPIMTY